jgi:hypothetical protein
MGWVRNVVLMNVYLGLEKPQGVGISGEGPHRQVREMRGGQFTSNPGKRWTDPVTARRVPSKWKGVNKGSKGIIMYITYLVRVCYGMIAVMNDTSCIYMHDDNNRNECC